MLVPYVTIALCILSCVQAEEVKGRNALVRVKQDINSLKTRVTALEQAAAQTSRVIKTWNAALKKMMSCINLPHIEGTKVAMSATLDGKILATYSCRSDSRQVSGNNVVSECDNSQWSAVDIVCTKFQYCYSVLDGRGVYSGRMAHTKSGRTCQKWTSTSPHSHTYTTESVFTETAGVHPETMDDVANYCRDPDKEGAPWCYTTDVYKRWEFCMLPKC